MLVLPVAVGMGTGCRAAPVYITGAEDIGRLRGDLEQLDSQYQQLLADNRRLAEENARLVERYRETTEEIRAGLDRLADAGGAIQGDIDRLRTSLVLIRDILQKLADFGTGTGGEDPGPGDGGT
jgi:hypothetical protein